MKKLIIIICIFLPLVIWAQEVEEQTPEVVELPEPEPDFMEAPSSADSLKYHTKGAVGAITIDGVTYSQIRLRPELEFGKIGFCLDIDLLFDAQGKFSFDRWDSWQDFVGKVLYVRYAERNDSFYFKTGSISDYTLAQGLIFNNFSNMLRYPEEKNIGGYIGFNTGFSGIGMEIYTHDIFRNQILAGNLHAKPLSLLKVPWLQKLYLGFNVGLDRDQYGRFEDSDNDGVPDIYDRFPNDPNCAADTDGDGTPDERDWDLNGDGYIDHPSMNPYVDEIFPNFATYYPDYPLDTQCFPDSLSHYTDKKPISIYSIDLELPLMERGKFLWSTYGELAFMDSHGSGFIFPGFKTQYSFLQARLEFRNFGSGFLPSYFDRTYEGKRSEMKVVVDPNTNRKHYFLSTKDEILANTESSLGWFGLLQADFPQYAFLRIAYQDMYSSNKVAGKSLWFKLGVTPSFIPKIKQLSVYYSQSDVNRIDFINLRNERAYVLAELVYQISENANLMARYSEFYTDVNRDGRIRGKAEIEDNLGFGVEFLF